MSQENVEIVQQALTAVSGSDLGGIVFDSSLEWDMSGVAGWPDKRVYRGQEVGEMLRGWAESWRDWSVDITDLRDLQDERVFAAIHERGVVTESGASVEQFRYQIFTVRGGVIIRVQMFSERDTALEAAGLSE